MVSTRSLYAAFVFLVLFVPACAKSSTIKDGTVEDDRYKDPIDCSKFDGNKELIPWECYPLEFRRKYDPPGDTGNVPLGE